jgi:hypothetical protein
MSVIFQRLDNSGLIFGKHLNTAEANIQPGLLCLLSGSGLTVSLCDASHRAKGFAFGARTKEYRPTSKVFDSGEECALLMGDPTVLLSVDFFSSGSLPAADAALYTAASGKIATSGSYKVGYCIRQETAVLGTGGTGTSQALALCRFNFDALD